MTTKRYATNFTEKELKKMMMEGMKTFAHPNKSPYVAATTTIFMATVVERQDDGFTKEERAYINEVFRELRLSQGVKEEDIRCDNTI